MALAADKKKSKIADVDVPQEKKKREKRSKNRTKIVTKDPEDEEEQTEKASKKRKRETAVDQDESAPPKKRKNKTGFLDPSEDSDLSEQAQKALEYAFTQFRHPKRWKFHKARQNWLIRNIWSPENIPDPHVPLVIKYLSNVQGGVRENLIKTCQSHLTSTADTVQPAVEQPSDVVVPPTDAKTPAPVEDVSAKAKAERARLLLDVLNAAEPATASS